MLTWLRSARRAEPCYPLPIEPAGSPGGLPLCTPASLRQSAVDHRERYMTRRNSLGIGRRLDKLSDGPDMIRHTHRRTEIRRPITYVALIRLRSSLPLLK